MIKLYQFNCIWGIPNLSCFCCKVETYLRTINIPYGVKATLPSTAPKGKLPYIEDGNPSFGDSAFIITHLKRHYQDLDQSLNSLEQSISIVIQRLIEENLFWITLFSRWQYTEANWRINKEAIFGSISPLIRNFIAAYYRRKIKQQIYGHGIGRYTPSEIFARGNQDIDVLSTFLGNKAFFCGNLPITLDTSAFGMLVNIIQCPIESPLKDHALTKQNLVEFVERTLNHYYLDLKSA
ncbi:MAG: glutathione S-transferase family protein [Nitrosomonas sp.]|nr:glutathione S-transferase family protein [Nitrosomonas sp.]